MIIFLLHFKYAIQLFLLSIFSYEKADVNLIEDPVYMMILVSLVTYKILYLILFFYSLIMCLGVNIFEFVLSGEFFFFFSISVCVDSVFTIFGKFGHYFLKYSFSISSSSGTPKFCTWVCSMVSHRFLRLFGFFFIFFLSYPQTG